MKSVRGAAAILLVVLIAAASGTRAPACDCKWAGPFLKMGPQSTGVVRARVLNYAEEKDGKPQAMDLEILEVLCGDPPDNPLRVWGDDGSLCRPSVTQFPVGTQWVFALNGPGSKPGEAPGPAISVCGQFWLQIKSGLIVGPIDAEDMKTEQTMTPAEFRRRLADALEPAPAPQGPERRAEDKFTGEVSAGKVFEQKFGPGLVFRLEPIVTGWIIEVKEEGKDEDFARLTPPYHVTPNPREIEGWHFRNADNSGPNEEGEKNVNAPGAVRDFVFSPEVGKSIQGPGAKTEITLEDFEKVRRFGQGQLTILEYRLDHLEPREQAGMSWMRFEVTLSWPENPAAVAAPPANPAVCKPLPWARRN